MAELMTSKTLFPGNDHIDQLHKIMKLVGTPGPEFLKRITSDEARRYIASLQSMPKRDFRQYFLGANADGMYKIRILTFSIDCFYIAAIADQCCLCCGVRTHKHFITRGPLLMYCVYCVLVMEYFCSSGFVGEDVGSGCRQTYNSTRSSRTPLPSAVSR